MPNNVTAKTKLAPKRAFAQAIMVVALLATIFGVVALRHNDATPRATIGGKQYTLEIADTAAMREQGLSGRIDMAKNHGMLFRYPNQGVRCFWMKDMHFPLDIIWLNAQNQVIKVARNVAPDTYPPSYCASPAQSVIELHAGEATSVRIGQTIQL